MQTPLEEFLVREIQEKGPLSLDVFHAHALFHPEHGYYRTQAVLGREGDFVTTPEISAMFCDIVAALLLHEWEAVLGAPPSFSLVELGPGRGILMAHILRTSRLRPQFQQGACVTLFEINPLLKKEQAEKLALYTSPQWVDSLSQLTSLPGPFLIIANEFFDTFPVKQWDMSLPHQPVERKVVWTGSAFSMTPDSLSEKIQEESPHRDAFWCELLALLKNKGGLLWLADYGSLTSGRGESWQGIYQGKASSPLTHVGLTDLSAHVPFDHLLKGALGFSVQGPMTQRDFLLHFGMRERLEILKKKASIPERAQLEAAFMRLTHPLQMGELFKVMMVRP